MSCAVERDRARRARALGVSSVRRLSERSSVVLPQPEGPISASTSPWRIGSETLLDRGLVAVGDAQLARAHALGPGAPRGVRARAAVADGRRRRPSAARRRRSRRTGGGSARPIGARDRRRRRRPRAPRSRRSCPDLVRLQPVCAPRAAIASTAKFSAEDDQQQHERGGVGLLAARCPRPRASCCRRSSSASSRCRAAAPTPGNEPSGSMRSVAPSRITTIAVSPTMRPMPSAAPVAMFGATAGSSTRRIVAIFVLPSA